MLTSPKLWFIATRPNPSGAPICTTAQNKPNGTWVLQDVGTGKYVTSSNSRPSLYADTPNGGLAAAIVLSSVPGGITLRANATSQYVTADESGKYALSAQRDSASAWEIFSFQLLSGTTDQYTMTAHSNKKYVALGDDGALMPTAASSSTASVFRLVEPPKPVVYAGPKGTWALQEVSTGKLVSSSNSRPDLYADTTNNALAVPWTFGSALGASTIQSNVTRQYVTADIGGTSALSASRGVAQAWEVFALALKDGSNDQYVIAAGSNQRFVATNAQGALVPSATSASGAAAFKLIVPPQPANPTGNYYIQDAASQNYIVASGSLSQLVAGTTNKANGSVFAFTGSSLSIQSIANKQFLTGDPSASSPISAARSVASAWETFWVDKSTGTNGSFTILALVNNLYIATSSSGALYNNASTVGSASAFNLVKAL